ncbi:hypothetical protein VTK73DRAFT_6427 [Phialemonium thermophilum]|uniref:Uncharacterized protein n=1 Tax=Phialemonium thermophilum TaxID=223376 RepID=A0ABR3V069_9PEZI
MAVWEGPSSAGPRGLGRPGRWISETLRAGAPPDCPEPGRWTRWATAAGRGTSIGCLLPRPGRCRFGCRAGRVRRGRGSGRFLGACAVIARGIGPLGLRGVHATAGSRSVVLEGESEQFGQSSVVLFEESEHPRGLDVVRSLQRVGELIGSPGVLGDGQSGIPMAGGLRSGASMVMGLRRRKQRAARQRMRSTEAFRDGRGDKRGQPEGSGEAELLTSDNGRFR